MKFFSYSKNFEKLEIRFLFFKFTKRVKFNKNKFDKKIKNFKDNGLSSEERMPRLVVSLTSFPERMKDIHYTLYSLLNQSLKPDKLILWLTEEEFPNKENDVPDNVLKLKNNGLAIKWCKNIKSYKKLIPILKLYENDIIVTADDDIFYPTNWLELLYKSYLENKDCVHCHRAHRIKFSPDNEILPYMQWELEIRNVEQSFLNFSTSGGGVLYPPNSFYKDILREDLFCELAPYADDIWFWAMCVLNNKKIKVVENNIYKCLSVNKERDNGKTGEYTLFSINRTQNDVQLNNVLEYYPQIKKMLLLELEKQNATIS